MTPSSRRRSGTFPRLLLGIALALAGTTAPASSAAADDEAVRWTGARVWTGAAFERGDLVVVGDAIANHVDIGGPVRTVDATDRWIVPAFADAHHHVTSPTEEASARFLADGTLFVFNANTVAGPFDSATARAFLDRPDSYDVALAFGGLTLPGGHPESLYVDVLTRYVYPGASLEDFVGDAFHYVADDASLDAALDALVALDADLVKTYLLGSEDFDARRDDPDFRGNRGLDPDFFPTVVAAAHARGLRVAVHVETDHDARVAAEAGADVLAHLPGYGRWAPVATGADPKRLTPATVAALAEAGTLVVPTYSIAASRYARLEPEALDEALRSAHFALQRDNVRALVDAGVTILAGTDGFAPVVDEAAHLTAIGALTRPEALESLAAGARLIHPDRRIACLRAGCEANFLVLDADPLAADRIDPSTIEQRVKAGRTLPAPDA